MTPEDRILNHYEKPYHRHIAIKPNDYTFYFTGNADNDCGDHIQLWGRYDHEERIIGIWWEGSGCCFSQAAASMLTKHCETKRLYEVKSFTQDDMLALFGVDVEPGRIECVLVAYRALMKALEKHNE